MSAQTILAWHFTGDDKKLGYGDGRQVRAGRTLKVKFPWLGFIKPTLCEAGMHGSENILHALKYAHGPYLWRVEMSGDIVRDDEKLVAASRKALWGFDAYDILRTFARRCALDVVHLWDAPDIVRRFLETGDESIRHTACGEAWAAEWAAKWAAGRFARRAAVRSAAKSAAMDAAMDAALDKACAAVEEAARAKAYAAARVAGRATLRDEAWNAAWGAARYEQAKTLETLVIEHAKSKGMLS